MDALILFVCIQTMLIPILGGLYIGIRNERMKKEALFYRSIQVVQRLRRPYA